jgi:NitT/TauT family transport system substrate-binding protein
VFRRTRLRLHKTLPALSVQDLIDASAPLREAVDIEMPADSMDPQHRARLLFELVDAMNHPHPTAAQDILAEPAENKRPASRKPITKPSDPEPLPQRKGRHRAHPRRSQQRRQTRDSPARRDDRRRPRGRTKPTVIGSFAAVVAIVVAVLTLRSTSPPTAQDGILGVTSFGHVHLRVGVLPVVDVAPFYQAVEAGYFARNGLDVDIRTVQSGPEAVAELVAGQLDVAFGSYPAILQAQSDRKADLQIIAPAYTALPGHLMLVAPPNGHIQQPKDVDGKRIAVTGTGSISDLGVESQLENSGAGFSSIHWKPMAMPDMSLAMQRGEVDGAVLAEPYITLTDKAFQARPILDVAIAGTARLPVSGWATSAKLSRTNPEVIAGFVSALGHGIEDVSHRDVLDPLLARKLSVSQEVAKDVRIAEYTKTLNPSEIQRVADLMLEFNVIHRPLDVRPMLLPP